MLYIILVFVFFMFLSQKKRRWIKYGKLQRSKFISSNEHQYYLEEALFKDFHDAIHHLYIINHEINSYAKALEVKYDYFDWSYTIFRFEHTTIKIIRIIDRVILIKSLMPISIEDFEFDNPKL